MYRYIRELTIPANIYSKDNPQNERDNNNNSSSNHKHPIPPANLPYIQQVKTRDKITTHNYTCIHTGIHHIYALHTSVTTICRLTMNACNGVLVVRIKCNADYINIIMSNIHEDLIFITSSTTKTTARTTPPTNIMAPTAMRPVFQSLSLLLNLIQAEKMKMKIKMKMKMIWKYYSPGLSKTNLQLH